MGIKHKEAELVDSSVKKAKISSVFSLEDMVKGGQEVASLRALIKTEEFKFVLYEHLKAEFAQRGKVFTEERYLSKEVIERIKFVITKMQFLHTHSTSEVSFNIGDMKHSLGFVDKRRINSHMKSLNSKIDRQRELLKELKESLDSTQDDQERQEIAVSIEEAKKDSNGLRGSLKDYTRNFSYSEEEESLFRGLRNSVGKMVSHYSDKIKDNKKTSYIMTVIMIFIAITTFVVTNILSGGTVPLILAGVLFAGGVADGIRKLGHTIYENKRKAEKIAEVTRQLTTEVNCLMEGLYLEQEHVASRSTISKLNASAEQLAKQVDDEQCGFSKSTVTAFNGEEVTLYRANVTSFRVHLQALDAMMKDCGVAGTEKTGRVELSRCLQECSDFLDMQIKALIKKSESVSKAEQVVIVDKMLHLDFLSSSCIALYKQAWPQLVASVDGIRSAGDMYSFHDTVYQKMDELAIALHSVDEQWMENYNQRDM